MGAESSTDDPQDSPRRETPSQGDLSRRFLGVPVNGIGRRARLDEESRRLFGVPVSLHGTVDWTWLRRSVTHPARTWRYWRGRRRFGPFASEWDDC